MAQMNDTELQAMGYKQKFDYSQYSHDNDVNVIPKKDFKRLIRDTFKTITETVRETYGPYGSIYTLNEMNQTSSTKDGYNTFEAIHFSHQYKQMVKLMIGKICTRVNEVVGDGTTSCLLLAEKIFDAIGESMKTPEDERRLEGIIDDIQKFFNDSLTFGHDYEIIKSLDQHALESVIMMASNHDKRLRDTIVYALDVKYDAGGNVLGINNVVVQSTVEHGSSTKYDILKMPGKYRARVYTDPGSISKLSDKTKVVMLAYDHNFNDTDFEKFICAYKDNYMLNKPVAHLNDDGTLSKNPIAEKERPIIVLCATNFNQATIDQFLMPWLKLERQQKRDHTIVLATIQGVYPRNEIRDLAAVCKIKTHGIYDPNIKFEEFDKYNNISIFNNNCLCVYDVEPPVHYIDSLNIDMMNEESSARKKVLKERIDALTMAKNDTTINLTVPNTLEEKMVIDKINDCLSIINSAYEHGCVPNLFKYAHTILQMYKPEDDRTANIVSSIIKSIEGIFMDVWNSKYASDPEFIDEGMKRMNEFYSDYMKSYDIINDTFVDVESLATSVQYDVEVVCATLEIIKFLLTSRGLIFDSCLLQMHGDRGTYVPV